MKMKCEKSDKNGILKNKKLFVFDLDGTVYLGNRIFPEAVRLVNSLIESGRRVLFFTNNASKSPDFYLEKLRKSGFEIPDESVMTSGDVTASFLLKNRAGKTVYLLANSSLKKEMSEKGIKISDGQQADIVVSSFDTELTFEKLTAACNLISDGAEYICTHPDLRCPTENGYLPDSGAISAMITAATGVNPVFFGKPHAETMLEITEKTGCRQEEICIVGDRIYTDIAFAVNSGATSVLVLTGETDEKMLSGVPEESKPDFVFDNADGIYKAVFGL